MRILFSLVLLVCTCAVSYGQNPYYSVLGTAQGLPSNTIYQVSQDEKGYIWISHDHGLSRYDGYTIKTYSGVNQSFKAGSNIKVDSKGRVWYETFDGYIFYVENDSLIALPKQRQPMGFLPFALLDDVLAVCGRGGVDLYDINTLKIRKSIELDLGTYATCIGNNKQINISVSNFNIKIDSKGNVSKSPAQQGSVMLSEEGREFVLDRVNFDGKIFVYEGEELKLFINRPGVHFIQGLISMDSMFWVCTPDGVWRYTESGMPVDKLQPLLKGKNISGVFKDREGNFWFSTLNEGVLFVPDIESEIALSGNASVQRIAVDKQHVLVATDKNEIYEFYPRSSGMQLAYKDEIAHQVNALALDSFNGHVLLSAQILKVFDGKFNRFAVIQRPVKEAIPLDEKYYAFAATGAAGLLKMKDGKPSKWDKLYNRYSGIYQNESILLAGNRHRGVIYNAQTGNLYFSGSRGLYRFHTEATDGVNLVLDNQKVFVSHMDIYKEYLVVISPNNSMLLFDKEDNAVKVKAPSDVLLYKTYVLNGDLYVLTNKGIKRFNYDSLSLGNTDLLRGIRPEEVNDIKQFEEMLLVATNKGLITIPKGGKPTSMPPLFHITEVWVNDRKISTWSNLQLSHRDNNIEIKYATPAYSAVNQYPVYYKINNSEWMANPANSRSLNLASLSPGDYTITFAQGLGEGTLHNAAVMKLSIAKPYWMTFWFWGLVLVGGGAIAYAYYKWQTGILKNQNVLLAEKVELERNLHKSVLMAIRSQMNPHFFYNALNTIQSFIITDDKRNAATYLSKFSKLTRTILEMTGKEAVTLQEEVNSLQLYLDLEKVRFNNELNYSIHVARGLDAELVKIPSMIVQPYIENSIKHGLLHKNGEKILLIDFLKREDNLTIVIDDNGIGRKRSRELNKIRADKHKPFATEANMKRIELLNRGNNNIGVVYTDKRDAFGQSNGTIVTITIPLLIKELSYEY